MEKIKFILEVEACLPDAYLKFLANSLDDYLKRTHGLTVSTSITTTVTTERKIL